MSDLEAYRLKARAWLESVKPTFGRAAQAGLSDEAHLALERYLVKVRQALAADFG